MSINEEIYLFLLGLLYVYLVLQIGCTKPKQSIMRNLSLTITLSILSMIVLSQNSFYIGAEMGGVLQRYNYENEKGISSTQTSIPAILGGYFGYTYHSYSIETGFYALYQTVPLLDYNTLTFEVSKSTTEYIGRQVWLIPVRLGKTFLTTGNKLFFRPEIGANLSIYSSYNEENNFISFLPQTASEMLNEGYFPSKFVLGIEPGASIGYRFNDRAAIHLRCSYMIDFTEGYYEELTHLRPYSVKATRTMKNTAQLKIGFTFHFPRP
jgi:hypothetical protein